MISVDNNTYAHAKVSVLYIYVIYHIIFLQFIILRIIYIFIYMQEHYNYEDPMEMVQVIRKLHCHQSEEELDQTIEQFWIDHETLWSRTGSFQTSYIWKSSAIKDGKSYLCHNLYAKPFAKVLGLVGFWVTSKILVIGPPERNYNYTIYAIILLRLNPTAGPFTLSFICYLQYNFNSQYRYNPDYLKLLFDSIA